MDELRWPVFLSCPPIASGENTFSIVDDPFLDRHGAVWGAIQRQPQEPAAAATADAAAITTYLVASNEQ